MAPIKSIAIIGAGPAGAIALDALAQEKEFDSIRVFERREKAGGCWSVFLSYSENGVSIVVGSMIPKIIFSNIRTSRRLLLENLTRHCQYPRSCLPLPLITPNIVSPRPQFIQLWKQILMPL